MIVASNLHRKVVNT